MSKDCTKDKRTDGHSETDVCQTLKSDTATCEGLTVHYRLCVFRFSAPQYYVDVVLKEERAAAYLGTDEEASRSLYEALVRGFVTPCTLQAIIEDSFSQNALQKGATVV